MGDTGNKIKQLRVARGYTQQEMAEIMNTTRTQISRWETNEREMTLSQLQKYADVTGVSLNYFQDKSADQTMFETLAELSVFFSQEGISEATKDHAYQDIMKIYLNSKEMLRLNEQSNNQINSEGSKDTASSEK